jgi:hypothetical protein
VQGVEEMRPTIPFEGASESDIEDLNTARGRLCDAKGVGKGLSDCLGEGIAHAEGRTLVG